MPSTIKVFIKRPSQTWPDHEFNVPWKVFSGGEVNVQLGSVLTERLHSYSYHNSPNLPEEVVVFADIRDSEGIMALLNTTNAIRNCNTQRTLPISLVMPYIPYARQDRVCNTGESFSLETFAALINSQNYNKVTVVDAHSDISTVLINNCTNCIFINHDLFPTSEPFVLVAPDLGAIKRTSHIQSLLEPQAKEMCRGIVYADKTRSADNSDLSVSIIKNAGLLNNPTKHAIVVDDICDGGRTFNAISEAVHNARKDWTILKLNLHLSHGIFSHGKETLYESYDRVYALFDWTKENILSDITKCELGLAVK